MSDHKKVSTKCALRKQGHSRLVYDKDKKKFVTVDPHPRPSDADRITRDDVLNLVNTLMDGEHFGKPAKLCILTERQAAAVDAHLRHAESLEQENERLHTALKMLKTQPLLKIDSYSVGSQRCRECGSMVEFNRGTINQEMEATIGQARKLAGKWKSESESLHITGYIEASAEAKKCATELLKLLGST